MPKIFLCYRRDDNPFAVDMIDEALNERFGREAIVRDIDTFPLGQDFRLVIEEEVKACDILLAIIGDRWLDIQHTAGAKVGERRVDDPSDFVRLELEAALERDIPIIPVLVDRAGMPSETDLPASLHAFVYRGAAEARSGRDRQIHIRRLISGIANIIEELEANPPEETTSTETVVDPIPQQEVVGQDAPPLFESPPTIPLVPDLPDSVQAATETRPPDSENRKWFRGLDHGIGHL